MSGGKSDRTDEKRAEEELPSEHLCLVLQQNKEKKTAAEDQTYSKAKEVDIRAGLE